MTDFICLYFGRPDECPECGGFNDTGTRFCSHECAADWDERGRQIEAEAQARRDRDDAFGRECERLRALGHTDAEIDALTASLP